MLLPSAGRRNSCPRCNAKIGIQSTDIRGYGSCPKCGARIWATVVDNDARYYADSPVETALIREALASRLPFDFSDKLSLGELRDRIVLSGLLTVTEIQQVWEREAIGDSYAGAYALIDAGLLSRWCLHRLYFGWSNELANGLLLRDMLGRGHTCDVLLASRHEKRLSLKITRLPGGIVYLENECAAVRGTDSPHLVQCLETTVVRHATAGERPCLVREYVCGLSLRRVVDAVGPLPPDLNAHVFLGAARGLQALHDRGIVHQRISPKKILVTERGEGKLICTGLMCKEGEGFFLGDPLLLLSRYVAPEVARGLGSRESDVYSLGASLEFAMKWPESDQPTSSQPGPLLWIGELDLQETAEAMTGSPRQARPDAPAVVERLAAWLAAH